MRAEMRKQKAESRNWRQWLDRFLPAPLRKREILDRDARAELWEKVVDNDPCLRAVLNLETEMLEAEFFVLVNPQSTEADVNQARAGMRKAFYTLKAIEDERAAAIEERQEREMRKVESRKEK